MPLVDIHVIKGIWSKEQKEEMMRVTTDALCGVWGDNVRKLTWVRVIETEEGQWMIDGQVFTADHVARLRAGEL
jgi:4-oxalocrotonate tautomerase